MSKESLKTKAYQIIKQKILDCEFQPGTLLNENYLSNLLSISRTPIRDALSRLEHERLIRIVQPKGILVETITLQEFNAYFESCLFLEPYALRSYGHKIPKHELEIFLRFFQTWEPPIYSETYCHIISSLHSIIVEETNNPYFTQTSEQLGYQEQRLQKLFPLTNEQVSSMCIMYKDFLALCLDDEWQDAADTLSNIINVYKDGIFPSFLIMYTNELQGETK